MEESIPTLRSIPHVAVNCSNHTPIVAASLCPSLSERIQRNGRVKSTRTFVDRALWIIASFTIHLVLRFAM